MNKLLFISLMSINFFLNGELLNHKMQPATNGMEVATWQPKPLLVPLLDKFYAEVSQTDHTYQANADFMFSFAEGFHKWKSEEEKLEAQCKYRYMAIYLRFALDLLNQRNDLVQRYVAQWKESVDPRFTETDFWDYIYTYYTFGQLPITPDAKLMFFFTIDVTVEQEIEKYVELSLNAFYKQ